MKDAIGVGLAATQVGVLRRVFVFSPADDEVLASSNPQIVRAQRRDRDRRRGLPVAAGRHRAGRAAGLGRGSRARTSTGAEVGYDLEGLPARIAQHEFDHLDGVLILDRTTPEARREALATLRPRVVLG